jgi:hypothetical protein
MTFPRTRRLPQKFPATPEKVPMTVRAAAAVLEND